jgi:hypothetical protein
MPNLIVYVSDREYLPIRILLYDISLKILPLYHHIREVQLLKVCQIIVVDIKLLISLFTNGYHAVAVLRNQHSYHNLVLSRNRVDFGQIVEQSLIWLEMLRSVYLFVNHLIFSTIFIGRSHLLLDVALHVLFQT